MIKAGLIGYGKWGSVLFEKIKNHARIRFVVTGNHSILNDEAVMRDVEWIFVATPDHTHYEIVKQCIQKGLNVFCEKPLAPTKEQSEDLYRLAEAYDVKLYVDDILNHKEFGDMLGWETNTIKRTKSGGGIHKDILPRLAYHDFYLLYDRLDSPGVTDVMVHDYVDRLDFEVEWGGTRVRFIYDINAEEKMHCWNDESLYTPVDGLDTMVWKVLTGKVDFEHNKRCSLFANQMIDELTREIFPNVAVVGGGIFGCTAAWMLSKNGFSVELFEQHNAIIREASNINQYRLHRGYHYPRSIETALSSKASEQNFLDVYGKSILDHNITHEYRIASEGSLVTAEQYKEFLDEVGLEYETVFDYTPGCDLSIDVNEKLFNSAELRRMCYDYLDGYGVEINIFTEVKKEDLVEFDYTVIATYAGINQLLDDDDQRDYQFELCEKPIVELPDKYKNKSIVIMDGPFMCIDPYQDTKYHVMGNVVHAIHHTNVGKQPDPIWREKFQHLLNKGCVKSPSITNIDKFIESGKKYLLDIEKLKHIGSMYTYRVVLPNRDHDDARPTEVEKINDETSVLFSGKIGTCVTAAKELVTSLKRKFYGT